MPPPRRIVALTCGGMGSGAASAALQDGNRAYVTGPPLPGFWFMPSRHASRRDLEVALANARGKLRQQERELQAMREEADVLREAAEALR